MNMGNGPRCQFLLEADIEIIDLACLNGLERPRAERRDYMSAQQIFVPLDRPVADKPTTAGPVTFNLLAIEQDEPPIHPLAERHLVRRDVLTDVTGPD